MRQLHQQRIIVFMPQISWQPLIQVFQLLPIRLLFYCICYFWPCYCFDCALCAVPTPICVTYLYVFIYTYWCGLLWELNYSSWLRGPFASWKLTTMYWPGSFISAFTRLPYTYYLSASHSPWASTTVFLLFFWGHINRNCCCYHWRVTEARDACQRLTYKMFL